MKTCGDGSNFSYEQKYREKAVELLANRSCQHMRLFAIVKRGKARNKLS